MKRKREWEWNRHHWDISNTNVCVYTERVRVNVFIFWLINHSAIDDDNKQTNKQNDLMQLINDRRALFLVWWRPHLHTQSVLSRASITRWPQELFNQIFRMIYAAAFWLESFHTTMYFEIWIHAPKHTYNGGIKAISFSVK